MNGVTLTSFSNRTDLQFADEIETPAELELVGVAAAGGVAPDDDDDIVSDGSKVKSLLLVLLLVFELNKALLQ